jgi:hypothetical protein
MKTCCKCRREKLESEFGKNKINVDGLQRYCKECKRKIARVWYNSSCKDSHLVNVKRNNRKYRNIMRNAIWEYLQIHPCVDCSETDPIVLEFDHVRGKKKYNISCLINSTNVDLLLEEIKKCEVRCANCHKRKTAKQFQNYKYIRSTT